MWLLIINLTFFICPNFTFFVAQYIAPTTRFWVATHYLRTPSCHEQLSIDQKSKKTFFDAGCVVMRCVKAYDAMLVGFL